MVGTENGPDGQPARIYYINGERAAQFHNRTASSFGNLRQPWEALPDGSVAFIGPETGGLFGGSMKRIKVTPAPGANLATWIAEVKAAKEKEIGDANAKKEKVIGDAKAAKEKAEADRLARKQAAEEAAAKRKADAAAKKAELDAARKAKTTPR